MDDRDWPYYIDDPLVDQSKHRLELHTDEVESARRGYQAQFGTCSCGEFVTPTWDYNGVAEAFDGHIRQVQMAAHTAARAKKESK